MAPLVPDMDEKFPEVFGGEQASVATGKPPCRTCNVVFPDVAPVELHAYDTVPPGVTVVVMAPFTVNVELIGEQVTDIGVPRNAALVPPDKSIPYTTIECGTPFMRELGVLII